MAVLDLLPEERRQREEENGWAQFRRTIELVRAAFQARSPFVIEPAVLQELNRLAVEGLVHPAGHYRTEPTSIDRSAHAPPLPGAVAVLVEEMCDYVNRHWLTRSAIHLAAYLMWRVNWIHPFEDGNGRAARALSYLILSVRIGEVLPGTITVMELVAQDKGPYWRALECADGAWRSRRLDVSEMEALLDRLVGQQLATDSIRPRALLAELHVLASLPLTPPPEDE